MVPAYSKIPGAPSKSMAFEVPCLKLLSNNIA